MHLSRPTLAKKAISNPSARKAELVTTKQKSVKIGKILGCAVIGGVALYFAVKILIATMAIVAAGAIGFTAVMLYPTFLELLAYNQLQGMIAIWKGNPGFALRRNLFDMNEDHQNRSKSTLQLIGVGRTLEDRHAESSRRYPDSATTRSLLSRIDMVRKSVDHQKKLLANSAQALEAYEARIEELEFDWESDQQINKAAGILSALTGQSRRAAMRQVREDTALKAIRSQAAEAMAALEMSQLEGNAFTREVEVSARESRMAEDQRQKDRDRTIEAAPQLENESRRGLFDSFQQQDSRQTQKK